MIFEVKSIKGYNLKEWIFLRHYLHKITYYKFKEFYQNELLNDVELSAEFCKVLEYQFEYANSGEREEEQSNVQRVGEISYFNNGKNANSRSTSSKNSGLICDTLHFWLAAHGLFDRRLRQSSSWYIPSSWECEED